VDTDFLVAYLKAHIDQFPHLRVVLMSATLQESLFANYFQSPTVYVSGRTFPVQVHYLPEILSLVAQGQSVVAKERGKLKDSRFSKVSSVDRLKMHIGRGNEASTLKLPPFDAEIIAEVVIRIVQKFSKLSIVSATSTQQADTGDAVLVFLSGIQAIQKVERALRRRNMASMNASLFILHSSLPPEQQRRVFKRTVPGTWKIILSTNIAETSVTIDDVTHVVDCGLHKEMRYDSASNVSSLEEVAISKASARQRAGRAGRVRAGNAWRFYCEEFYDGPAMAEYAVPEIRRVPLEEVVLQVLLLRLGLPEAFLGGCIEPPPQENIRHSIHTLLEIKAILPQPSFPLTALGYHLAKLPVDVHLGKMLITGALLNCIEVRKP
jgi:HrpA-like RNA helicase